MKNEDVKKEDTQEAAYDESLGESELREVSAAISTLRTLVTCQSLYRGTDRDGNG